MGFLTSLFGGETNTLTMVVALAIVLALIVLAVWLIKLMGQVSQTVGRGRHKRLAIIDSIAIDQKRQAVIVRRDDVEHLIVIGGANDLVVETGFGAPALVSPSARNARRSPAPASEPETPPANVARLDNALNARPRSLRHTGLLRTGADSGAELPGGKPERNPAVMPDSDRSDKNERREPEFETVADAGDGDSGETTTGRRNT